MKRHAAQFLRSCSAAASVQRRRRNSRPLRFRRFDVSAEDLLAQPVGENWTSYNGDYSGRRFSSLKEINRANVAQTARRMGLPSGKFADDWKRRPWSFAASCT